MGIGMGRVGSEVRMLAIGETRGRSTSCDTMGRSRRAPMTGLRFRASRGWRVVRLGAVVIVDGGSVGVVAIGMSVIASQWSGVSDVLAGANRHEQAELTAATSLSQFSRYVGIEVGSVLVVVVYVIQKSEARELKRGSMISRRQLSGWQSSSMVVRRGVLPMMGLTSGIIAGEELAQIPVA